MSEYIATITIERAARGDGDKAVLIAGASETVIASGRGEHMAVLHALEDATRMINAALAAKREAHPI